MSGADRPALDENQDEGEDDRDQAHHESRGARGPVSAGVDAAAENEDPERDQSSEPERATTARTTVHAPTVILRGDRTAMAGHTALGARVTGTGYDRARRRCSVRAAAAST